MAKKKIDFILTAVNHTKKSFDSVTKGLGTMAGGAARATKGIAKVGIAAGAAAGALAALVKVNVDFMDKLGKTASKLGIEVEFLQAMRFAAEQTGVKVEALDMGMQRFIRRAAEAARGTGESKRAFEQLGIQLTDTNGNLRPVRDVLFEVADGIQNTTSSAEKVRLAFKFFDSEGVSLVNTLKNGSEGMREFEQQAENLGIIISSQSIKKAEKFADSLNILKKQVIAISANITAAFIPILQDMSKHLTDFIVRMKGGDKTFEKFGLGIANTVIEFAAKTVESFGIFRDEFASMVNLAEFNLQKLYIAFAEFQINLLRMSPFKSFADEIRDLEWDIYSAASAMLLIGMRTTNFGEDAKKTANILRLYKIDLKNIKDTNDKFTESLKDTGGALGNIGSPMAVYKEQLEDVGKTIEQIGVKSMKSFEDAIVNGLKTGKLAFKDFASVVVEELIRVAIQQLVIKNLLTMFSFGTSTGTGSGSGGGGSRGGSFDGGGYTGMGARAGGVDGKGGFPAILHPNETVIDHTQGQGSGGATVNFNISTVDAAGFDQLLASRKGLITQIINNAMNTQGKIGVA